MTTNGGTPRRVLLVDDEPDFRELVKDWLEPDFAVTCFPDALNLIPRIKEINPDLLILDIMMPKLNGIEACRQIRRQGNFWSLPILFLTASHSGLDFLRSLDAGGTSYLTKPIGPEQLMRKVTSMLAQEGMAR